jgi:hypothetical protein
LYSETAGLAGKGYNTPTLERLQVILERLVPFSAKIFGRGGNSSASRSLASAAVVVAATVVASAVVAAAAIAAPAAAAEQDDNEDDDPQAAVAAPAVIAAPHDEYLLHMKVLRGLFAALNSIIWSRLSFGE